MIFIWKIKTINNCYERRDNQNTNNNSIKTYLFKSMTTRKNYNVKFKTLLNLYKLNIESKILHN